MSSHNQNEHLIHFTFNGFEYDIQIVAFIIDTLVMDL